ncbi:amino acid permease [Granulicella sp. WH15]|uniref:amino acid permease n=1 Tax=Granulicella sp. WH15 TaxID=2602070 RepID=UPI00136712BB|nr:amino acid permease [Granulicella sp. WH15]QHN03150.1 amino acid permease [Granulicella sp. WH15]
MANLLAIKPMSKLLNEAKNEGEASLKRSLGPLNLITLGIGAIIGAGIFVLTGQAAAKHAGPAVMVSFIFAGITCAFAGLCYAEFASLIPIAGSAYTYGYATLGEFVAWIIGWDLVLEYAFGAATVASGWSGYFVGLLQDFHIHIPPQLTTTPGTVLYQYHDRWMQLAALPTGVDPSSLPHAAGIFNLVAFLAIAVVTAVLVRGIEESANLNTVIVLVKLAVVGIFLFLGIGYILHNPAHAHANWTPFIPPSDGHGNFGFGGITAGAASIFFAYIGFDAVSTAAQEAKNPQRDMPIGILGSLVICTVLYILVSGVLTGLVNYRALNVADPVAVGIDVTGVRWGSILVKIGAVFGLGTVMLVMLLGQSRVFFSMSRDGLLWKWAGAIHPKFRTPWISNIVVGAIVAFMPAVLPIDRLSELVNMGTLLAFAIVCAGVWILRRRSPELPRPFKTPLVPLVPILGIVSALYLVWTLPTLTKEVVIGWLILGLLIYFTYSVKHSKVQAMERGEDLG